MVFRNPHMLILLLLLPALVLVWRWRGKRQKALVLALRLLMIGLVVLGLADPMVGAETNPQHTLVLLVDQSESLTPRGQLDARAAAASLAQIPAGSNPQDPQRHMVLWFGEHVVDPGDWDQTTTGQALPQSLIDSLNPETSDLAQALRTAREMLKSTGGRVVLISDGYQTTGDALAEAQRASQDGLVVDVLPIASVQGGDVQITSVSVPHSLRLDEAYDISVNVHRQDLPSVTLTDLDSTSTMTVTLQVWESTTRDKGKERLLEERQVGLVPGTNSFAFRGKATAEGLVKLRARVLDVPNDTFERNNTAGAATVVAPQPSILLVGGEDGSAQELQSALWRAGIQSDNIPTTLLPTRLSDLQVYEGMVLLDVPAHNLSLDQISSVREFVRSEGRGLVVTGGYNSFSLGGYADTPLEDLLPVSLDPPPRPQRSDVALLLMMDRSASMSVPVDVSKFDMAKEATVLSTEMLQSEDQIGVLSFDTRQYWTVPFQTVGQGRTLKQIQDDIVLLNVGGGTDIYGALQEGLGDLMRQNASVRHAVLLTDGRSFTNDMDAYYQLIQTARDNDVTLSTIAIGMDSDTELLNQLASWGGGRYYYADMPEDIPRMTLQESAIARADPVVEGQFYAELSSLHPMLRNVSPANLPNLDGYIATTRRENADVILQSPISQREQQGDPLLATWQYGLGRVVAWTPSVAEPWASAWTDWGDYGSFWAQIIRYTLPQPDSGPLQVHLEPQPGGARLVVDAFESGGNPLDLANVGARITLPDGTQHELLLYQIGPGRYVQNMLLPIEGAYGVEVVLRRDDLGIQYTTAIGYAHALPAEYTLHPTYRPSAQGSDYPQGQPLLEAIAKQTGGRVLDPQETLIPAETSTEQQSETPVLSPLSLITSNIWPWLLAAALVVWVLEIAVRRRTSAMI